MHKLAPFIAIAPVLVACLGACSAAGRAHAQPEDDPAVPRGVDVTLAAVAPPQRIVAVEGDGLALVDPADGASSLLAQTGGFVGDLAWDAQRKRLVTFELVGDEWGEVASYALDGAGNREVAGWLDGSARLWPVASGTVVFERSYGERWRLWRADGTQTTSHVAPLPLSAWSRAPSTIGALAQVDGSLVVVEARIEGDILVDAPTPIAAAASAAPTARAVPARDGLLVADAAPPGIILRYIVEGAPDVVSVLPYGSARLLQVLAIDDGAAFAVLLDEPPALLASSLDDDGRMGAPCTLLLDAPLPAPDAFFGRDLALAAPRRLAVAGRDRLWLVDWEPSAEGCSLTLAATVPDAHGPLAVVPRP